jgi:hypothetical protein
MRAIYQHLKKENGGVPTLQSASSLVKYYGKSQLYRNAKEIYEEAKTAVTEKRGRMTSKVDPRLFLSLAEGLEESGSLEDAMYLLKERTSGGLEWTSDIGNIIFNALALCNCGKEQLLAMQAELAMHGISLHPQHIKILSS